MKKAIAYYRVSRKRQEISGLSFEAQQKAVSDFAAAWEFKVIEEYQERRTGMKTGNPALSAALLQCRKQDAVLLIAKLDRLKRNVAFIATLMESRVPFLVVEQPHAEEFTLHILAAVAQKEGKDISKRTKDALAAAKRRGTELGKFGRYVLSKRNRELSQAFALKMQPTIARLVNNGFKSTRAIMNELNRLQIPTYRNDGSRWHLSTVHKIMEQIYHSSKSI